jgi:hypothetical protein
MTDPLPSDPIKSAANDRLHGIRRPRFERLMDFEPQALGALRARHEQGFR